LSCFSIKCKAHKPTFTATKAVKCGVGTLAGAATRSHAWLDVTQDAIQWITEATRLALDRQAGQDAADVEVAMTPMVTLAKAIPASSEEETGVPNARSTVASPTVFDLLRVIPNSLVAI
jgi:hypothetical protein